MRILLVGDDTYTVDRMKDSVDKDYVVDVAYNGEFASYLAQTNDYSAIVIESSTNSKNIDCVAVCKQVRESVDNTAIITIMDNDNENKIASIEAGADVILTKPIDYSELTAYMRSMIGRYLKSDRGSTLSCSKLTLNIISKEVYRGSKKIKLRKKEFILLEYLMLNKGRVVTKEKLLENIWEAGVCVNSNTLEVHLRNLRKKIDDSYSKKVIKTIYGFGYKIDH
ncbi:hypothetical protein A2V49_00580 [candidate division WWE3 bacterium RBG_19FT_COMBO_34_6]|uniref:DNA-binding response regulator n=1 Tax=candidate division WWE3 bacterium RBG_19FT_COMBO_34_6 TaxID=1802612 RepID=A0A1F4UNM6_UNCKA|nr:MAG: hypothetical protein A2V49_00580 [candidate division WWE3 bacterium RBG_19FT_COMBO_34_6]